MANPFDSLLKRCRIGFTLGEKLMVLGCGAAYVLFPLDFDFIPVIGWIDDGYAIFLVCQVMTAPTLSATELAAKKADAPLSPSTPRSGEVLALKSDKED